MHTKKDQGTLKSLRKYFKENMVLGLVSFVYNNFIMFTPMKIIGIPKSLCCVNVLIDLLFTMYIDMLVLSEAQGNEFRLTEKQICSVAPGVAILFG